jgi:hypothetical protein
MDNDIEATPEFKLACSEARNHLIKLTSEYYSLRAQCKNTPMDQNSQGNLKDARNVIIVDRLEEIAQETKKLLPSIYPQIEIDPPKTAGARMRRSKMPPSATSIE